MISNTEYTELVKIAKNINDEHGLMLSYKIIVKRIDQNHIEIRDMNENNIYTSYKDCVDRLYYIEGVIKELEESEHV